VKLLEAETMIFVAENSDVRVPRVYGGFVDPATKENFIFMDLVPGQTLEKLLPTLTDEEKDDIAQLVKEALTELRKNPDPGYIGGVGRTALPLDTFWTPGGVDPRIAGPFESEAACNEGLLRRLDSIQDMAAPFRVL
jgi:hypothetical protein